MKFKLMKLRYSCGEEWQEEPDAVSLAGSYTEAREEHEYLSPKEVFKTKSIKGEDGETYSRWYRTYHQPDGFKDKGYDHQKLEDGRYRRTVRHAVPGGHTLVLTTYPEANYGLIKLLRQDHRRSHPNTPLW